MNLLWLQAAGCGGCSMSLLCAEDPGLFDLLEGAGIALLWHPAFSRRTGAEVRDLLAALEAGEMPLDILCVEGSLLRGPEGTGRFQMMGGTGRPMIEVVRALAARARYVIAAGSCSAYGGVTSAGENLTDAVGLQFEGGHPGGALPAGFRSAAGLPVINVAGCPTHPVWVTETLLLLAAGALGAEGLDRLGRPRFYADHLVHHA